MRRAPLTDWLRLWTALCGLGLVLLLFRQPLGDAVLPRVSSQLGGDGVAPGFVVRVESTPADHGIVWIDGVERGPSPFVGNARCRDGEPVVIEVRADGFRPWTRTVACRDGGSLDARARLEREHP